MAYILNINYMIWSTIKYIHRKVHNRLQIHAKESPKETDFYSFFGDFYLKIFGIKQSNRNKSQSLTTGC